jgi:hypothetical protein
MASVARAQAYLRINDGLEGIWKEAVVSYCSDIILEKLSKTIKIVRIVGVPVEFRTEHLQNISQDRCRYDSPLSVKY